MYMYCPDGRWLVLGSSAGKVRDQAHTRTEPHPIIAQHSPHSYCYEVMCIPPVPPVSHASHPCNWQQQSLLVFVHQIYNDMIQQGTTNTIHDTCDVRLYTRSEQSGPLLRFTCLNLTCWNSQICHPQPSNHLASGP